MATSAVRPSGRARIVKGAGSGHIRHRVSSMRPVRRAAGTREELLALGIDFGTSGARGVVIDGDEAVQCSLRASYGREGCLGWSEALYEMLEAIPGDIAGRLGAISVDGTSATCLLVDRSTWSVASRPLMYNFAAGNRAVTRAAEIAPEGHLCRSPTSTLCKLLTFAEEDGFVLGGDSGLLLLHQADWLASLLHRRTASGGQTDYNNALKLGFEPGEGDYPTWLKSQEFFPCLPSQVVAPSAPFDLVDEAVATRFGLRPECHVVAGTTDSIAAFFASGADRQGDAVTSLGSTLAVKVLSRSRVDCSEFGVYSHKLWDDLWLAGGASNAGGAVLREHFTDAQVAELSQGIDASEDTGLGYYPLTEPGERFPVSDPDYMPRLEPRPSSDAAFLHGILEGIAAIESRGYEVLQDLGCDPVRRVFTCGGGARNDKWAEMRQRKMGVPVLKAKNVEAAFGSARLALRYLAEQRE